jgi:hypothetical protein
MNRFDDEIEVLAGEERTGVKFDVGEVEHRFVRRFSIIIMRVDQRSINHWKIRFRLDLLLSRPEMLLWSRATLR